MGGADTGHPLETEGLAKATRRNARQCIVTRERDPAEGLIRFVRGPDGSVVPDIAGTLPGRGAWVTARHSLVQRAASRQMFSRALKAEAKGSPDLADRTGSLLRDRLVRSMPLLRKGGDLVAGAGKVDSMVRTGEAALVLHAEEAAPDGVRKIAQAIHAAEVERGIETRSASVFTADELGLAFGGQRVIHAAIRRSGGGIAFTERLARFRDYFDAGVEGAGAPGARGDDPPDARRSRSDRPVGREQDTGDAGAS